VDLYEAAAKYILATADIFGATTDIFGATTKNILLPAIIN